MEIENHAPDATYMHIKHGDILRCSQGINEGNIYVVIREWEDHEPLLSLVNIRTWNKYPAYENLPEDEAKVNKYFYERLDAEKLIIEGE